MQRRIMVLILLSTVMLVFLVSYSVIVKANKPSVTPIDPYNDILSFYRTQIASNSLSEEEKEALTTKLKPLVDMATQRADAVQRRELGTLPVINVTVSPIVVYKLPDGIDENPVIPMFTSQLNLTNAWRKTVGDITYLVYAGALKNDPSQGVILMQVPGTVGFKHYYAPATTGLLTIVGYENLTLILTSEKSTTVYFDVLGSRFIGALDDAEDPSKELSTATPVAYPAP